MKHGVVSRVELGDASPLKKAVVVHAIATRGLDSLSALEINKPIEVAVKCFLTQSAANVEFWKKTKDDPHSRVLDA